MFKKILSVCLTVCLVVSGAILLTACGTNNETTYTKENSTTQITNIYYQISSEKAWKIFASSKEKAFTDETAYSNVKIESESREISLDRPVYDEYSYLSKRVLNHGLNRYSRKISRGYENGSIVVKSDIIHFDELSSIGEVNYDFIAEENVEDRDNYILQNIMIVLNSEYLREDTLQCCEITDDGNYLLKFIGNDEDNDWDHLFSYNSYFEVVIGRDGLFKSYSCCCRTRYSAGETESRQTYTYGVVSLTEMQDLVARAKSIVE